MRGTTAYVYEDAVDLATGYKIGPKVYNGTLLTPGTPGVSNWFVAQWGNSNELRAFNNQYSTATISARVVYTPSSNTLELALNGNHLACNVEANLFAAPTLADTYSTGPFCAKINVPLANTAVEIYHTITVKPTYISQVASTCITQGTFITSLILKNYDNAALTFFYQLPLHNAIVNPPVTPMKNWFFNGPATGNGNSWGYDDTPDMD